MATETPTKNEDEDLFPQPSMSALSGRSARRKTTDAEPPPATRQQEQDREDTSKSSTDRAGQPLDDDDAAQQRTRAAQPRARRRPQRAPRAEASLPEGETPGIPVSFQVSESVRRRLDKAQSQALTNTRVRKGHLEFILEALNAGAEEGWDAVLKASTPERNRSRFGGVRPLKDRDYAGTGSESLYVRMDEAVVAEIDKAVEEAGVPDRNKLVAMCLNLYLPGRKERPTGGSRRPGVPQGDAEKE